MTDEKNEGITLFDLDKRPVIKGYPELRWTGKDLLNKLNIFLLN